MACTTSTTSSPSLWPRPSAGDAPNGLLLVGDGQQAVSPGGFRLSEAGVDIRGDRGQVLRTNYRNGKAILDAALAVVAEDSFDDIDGLHTPGRRDVDLTYHDGQVIHLSKPTLAEHYDGRPVDAVKLGSYRRAKGLEFKRVYLPEHDATLANGSRTPEMEVSETERERNELSRSQLFVAMTRARDVLWLGSVDRQPRGR